MDFLLFFVFNLTRFLWKPCLKARRCRLTDRGHSRKCVTSKPKKQSNKEQSLKTRKLSQVKFLCLVAPLVLLVPWWRSVTECAYQLTAPLWPTKSPLSSRWFMTFPASPSLQEQGWYTFFSGPLNMSEGACQAIIAGPKTVQVMNIRQPGSVELAPILRATSVTVASGFTNLEKRYYQSTVRWPFEAVRTWREGRRGWKINRAPICPAKYSGVSHVLIFIVTFQGSNLK